jgi:hypothetical protein
MENITPNLSENNQSSQNLTPNPLDFDSTQLSNIDQEEREIRRFPLKTWIKGGLIAFFVIFFLILYFSPKTIVEPLKYYLNGDFGNEHVAYEEVDEEFDITSLFKSDGTVRLTEADFLRLVNMGNTIKFDRVESEQDKLILFVNLAKEGSPLWLGLTIEREDERLVFSRVGLGRIRLPEWMVENLIQNIFGKVVNKEGGGMMQAILGELFGDQLSVLISPDSLEFRDDEIVLNISKNPSLIEKLDLEGSMNDILEKIDEYDFNSIKTWFELVTNTNE